MKKTAIVLLVLFTTVVSAAERGGESPQATAKRFQDAYALRDIEEIAACLAERERGAMIFFNLTPAMKISTVLEGMDKNTLVSPSFTADSLPQDTEKRRAFVSIVKRNGIKVGGPPSPEAETDPLKHFVTIAGPNPDRTVAELDEYNRRYLGASNPTDQMFRVAPNPAFSNFEISGSKATAHMGKIDVVFVKENGRWFLSEFLAIKIKVKKQE